MFGITRPMILTNTWRPAVDLLDFGKTSDFWQDAPSLRVPSGGGRCPAAVLRLFEDESSAAVSDGEEGRTEERLLEEQLLGELPTQEILEPTDEESEILMMDANLTLRCH